MTKFAIKSLTYKLLTCNVGTLLISGIKREIDNGRT
jgi:hypothetical protein